MGICFCYLYRVEKTLWIPFSLKVNKKSLQIAVLSPKKGYKFVKMKVKNKIIIIVDDNFAVRKHRKSSRNIRRRTLIKNGYILKK